MNISILVVDDEEGVRYALQRLLSQMGYSCVFAKSGEEALERMEGQAFQLLITDLKLPGISGLDILRRFKSKFPKGKALILTGFPTVETAREAVSLGALGYLAKPFDKNVLETALNRCLHPPKDMREFYKDKLVLIVEDDPSFLSLLEALCALHEVPSVLVGDAEQALKKLESERLPDLFLIDIGLPGLSGLDLCRKIKNDPKTKDIPVILMTATLAQQTDIAEIAKKAGADFFTVKPLEPYELCFHVARLLKGGEQS